MKFANKKLLILGGKPIGSCEIVEYAKSEGAYVIVTDYLSKNMSAAKRIADECWDISTGDIEELKKMIISQKIDGIYTGVHEFNITKMIELCEQLNIHCYCTSEQWDRVDNKRKFKDMCIKYGIPVSKEYKIFDDCNNKELEEIKYPVIVKPVDGSGSRGFSICNNCETFKEGYQKAMKFSPTSSVLIEQCMDYRNSVIINYTIVDGKIIYSSMGDKKSKKVTENGAPTMSAVIYPSIYEQDYLKELDENVKKMFIEEGYRNGVIWIEAFCDNGNFTFNEMGYRFGGSLTYHVVKHRTGIDQLALQVEYSLNGKNDKLDISSFNPPDDVYMILPVHLKAGKITRIEGIEKLKLNPNLKQIVFVHYIGDVIEDWGSAQQVFAYIHFVEKNRKLANEFAKYIVDTIKVYDENGNQMLYNLYFE